MAWKRPGHLIGRDAELAAIDEVAGHATLVLVRGRTGIGKTALLAGVRRNWRNRGSAVVSITCSANSPQWDLFGVHAVLGTFRKCFHEIGDANLTRNIATLCRLCAPETYQSARGRAELFSELVRLFTRFKADACGAVLIDDVHFAPAPGLAVAAASRAGCTVVMAGQAQGVAGALADRIVDLGPLAADHMDELLAGAAPEPLDDVVAPAIRAALGSTLSGNPGAALDILTTLHRDSALISFDGHLCLRQPVVQPSLSAEHDLVRQVMRHGELGRQLVAVIAAVHSFHLDDLPIFAAGTGREPAACGQIVDELVVAGALEHDGHERLKVTCPALIPALLRDVGNDEITGVHRAIAEHMLRAGHTDPDGQAVLADHAALAGTALPATPTLGALLDHEATRMLREQPKTAARWYRAALRHNELGETRSRIRTELVHLLMRLGDYQALADVVAEEVRTGTSEPQPAELAVFAALSSVHTGQPVPGDVAGTLGRAAASRGPLEFAARWFTGSLRAGDIDTHFARDRSTGTFSGDQFDPVAEFRQVLGSAYGEPDTGPLTAYHRILEGYLAGDWTDLPAWIRALELTSPAHTPVHHAGRLLAAEMYTALGDLRRGAEWLARAGDDSPFPALHAWVTMGMASRAGQWERARKLGWAAHDEIGEHSSAGIAWLLSRQVLVEWRSGDHDNLPHLHAVVKQWHDRLGGAELRGVELTAQAGAEHDYTIALQAAEILRVHGNRGELMLACMIAASLADDPRPWYDEAYNIAKRVGSGVQRAAVMASMRDSGVPQPRERPAQSPLSDVQLRIVDLVCEGLTNRQIAGTLGMSEKTVENNLTRLFARTGCRSRLDLTLASMQGHIRLSRAG